jgi:hypothetical protein
MLSWLMHVLVFGHEWEDVKEFEIIRSKDTKVIGYMVVQKCIYCQKYKGREGRL